MRWPKLLRALRAKTSSEEKRSKTSEKIGVYFQKRVSIPLDTRHKKRIYIRQSRLGEYAAYSSVIPVYVPISAW